MITMHRRIVDVLALCALCVTLRAGGSAASKALMNLEHVNSIDPGAVCNDGSTGGYYISHSTSSLFQNIWLLYLEGGMWCYNNETCHYRYETSPAFMSSAVWPWSINLGGIFDTNPDKSVFAEANKVYAGYCSSDAWVGNTTSDPPTAETFGFHFRGARILRAVLGALVDIHQLGQFPGSKLLLAGCSAGARGAMVNADYITQMLEEVGVPNPVAVSVMLDSPMWLDLAPEDPAVVSLANQTQLVYGFANPDERIDEDCAAAFPGAPWKCLFALYFSYRIPSAQYRMPYLKTPYFLNAAQFDKFQIPYDLGGAGPPFDAPQLAFADAFQAATVAELATLPTKAQKNSSAVFSAACYVHCLSDEALFWGIRVNNESMRDLLERWYFLGESVRDMDNCTGFKCGQCKAQAGKAHVAKAPREKVVTGSRLDQATLILHTNPEQTQGMVGAEGSETDPSDSTVVGVTTGPFSKFARKSSAGAATAETRQPVPWQSVLGFFAFLLGLCCCTIRLVVRRTNAADEMRRGLLQSTPLQTYRTSSGISRAAAGAGKGVGYGVANSQSFGAKAVGF